MTKPILKWQEKARIMSTCANLPFGDKLYRFIQTYFGRLTADPTFRLLMQVKMLHWLKQQGMSYEGCTIFEVGTGHLPVVPIGFFLSGVDKVITVDLHKRLDFNLLQKSLVCIAKKRDKIQSFYAEIVNPKIFHERMNLLENFKTDPHKFLLKANIQYLAPADAKSMALSTDSIDYHISVTVMEHIDPETIRNILIEAKRILKPSGAAIHFIDLSDHFQHQDRSITKINFLKYSETEWLRIAGNEFAYCNRLRASEFLHLFDELGFLILEQEVNIDDEALKSLRYGFVVDQQFSNFDINDLCATNLNVMMI
jgi:SAM-dependent methyltransferase